MRYTAIALDYDGTIAKDGVVAPHVLAGLAALKASGRKLLLVTGRELEELLGIFPGITIFDRVVAENGALMYRPGTRERVELGEPPPQSLITALQGTGIPLAVGHTILATVRPHEAVVLECIAHLGLEQQVIFNKGAVMVLPPGCNKASGLKAALAELGLSPRNVVAGGDGENDHAMLELSEYSVATANGIATLKDAADYVTTATHGDGILEVIQGLLDSDLASMPPRRRRHALCLGRDGQGEDVIVPSRRTSLVIAGEAGDTTAFALTLLERLCAGGYQFCALDTRGDYLDFHTAIVFGTPANPPSPEELLSALEKPDVQTIACLAAVPPRDRPTFVRQLLEPLRQLRRNTGRPHWIVMDEAHDLLPASGTATAEDGAENTVYVTTDAATLAPAVLASVDGIAACGDRAGATLEALARAVSWPAPALPPRAPREDEALVWFRKSERPVALVNVGRTRKEAQGIVPERRESSDEVGQVLRRA
jgi:hydroxymethylpyrimidine pyrophosphatase-like HAD family hydrolase